MRHRSRRYHTMLLSYCAAIVLPVLFSMLLYPVLIDTLTESTLSQNLSMLSVFAKEQENYTERLSSSMDFMLLHPNILAVAQNKDTRLGQKEYKEYEAFSDITSSLPNTVVDDILIYYPETGRTISSKGVMALQEYYNSYLQESGHSLSQVTDYLSRYHYKEFLTFDGETVIFTCSDKESMHLDPSFQVCFLIDRTRFTDMAERMEWTAGIELTSCYRNQFILETLGKPMDLTMFRDAEQQFASKENTWTDTFSATVGSESDKKVLVRLESGNWTYYETIPYVTYQRQARKIQFLFIIGLSICIIAVLLLASYFTKKNYIPIKRVMQALGGDDEPGEITDEYKWLEEKAKEVFSNKELAEKQLDDQKEAVHRYEMAKLLDRTYNPEEDDLTSHFSGNYFLVSVINYYSTNNLKQLMTITDKQASYYEMLIAKTLDSFSLKDISYQFIMLHSNTVILLNAESPSLPRITTILEEANDKIREAYAINTTVFIGGEHEGKEGIHASYQEALSISHYTYLLNNKVFCYEELKDRRNTQWLGQEQEQKLINSISVHDGEGAKQIVHQMLSGLKDATPYAYRFSIFTILGYLAIAAERNDAKAEFEQLDAANSLTIDSPIETNEANLDACIDRIIAVGKSKSETKETSFISKISGYVEENYKDPNINISTIAYHFSMSPSYLSTLYRKEKGCSLLDTINNIRVEEAKRLLQTDDTIATISESLGFNDSNSFIRVFKKVTGITPGQMRTQNNG